MPICDIKDHQWYERESRGKVEYVCEVCDAYRFDSPEEEGTYEKSN